MGDPKDLVAKRHQFWLVWRRQAFVGGVLLLVLVPLYGVFRPLFEFLLFACSLAALTHPVLFHPVAKLGDQLVPGMSKDRRSEV